ncbi:XRE family transcriptional regulator [Agathobaculum butyriciproducens]|nr:XRE family transcriptional regulator [Agathobaculum butyriciproducens]RGC60059.1 XRE family transcriptional regulator [Agathobaculum butyriciproducens]
MAQLSDMLTYLRKRKGLSQQELANTLKISRSAIGMYETGKREPDLETLEVFADFYNVDMNTLTGKAPVKKQTNKLPDTAVPGDFSHLKRIPILGRIAAGAPIYAEENIEGYTFTDFNGGAEYFALRVRGDSMNAVRIYDGDLVIVRKQDIVENGEIAAVLIEQEATLKRFSRSGDIVTLMPQSTNPEHKPLVYNLKDTSVKILGLVVQVQFQPR